MSLVGVLSNPRSTRNLTGLDRIRDVIDDFDGVFHFEINDISDVSLALKRFAEQGVDVIALNGGDGTIQAAFSCLLREKPFTVLPPIAVLPAGKTNMIAEDLGAMTPKPHIFLRRLLEFNRKDRIGAHMARRHVLRVEGIPENPDLYGMFFGTAGIVKGIRLCRETIYPLGLPNGLAHPLVVGLLFFAALFGRLTGRSPLKTAPIAVRLDGPDGAGEDNRQPQQYFVITATTLDRLILGLRPFSKKGQGAVKFLAVSQRPASVLKAFMGTLCGTLGKKQTPGVLPLNVDQATLILNCPLTVDGELYDLPPDSEIRLSGTDSIQFIHFGTMR